MSWEYMCSICGKTMWLDWDARGCELWCDDCRERNDETDRIEEAEKKAHVLALEENKRS
jgi:hypothetical protein